MVDQVRMGIVGTSWWAERMYLRSIASHRQGIMTSICGRNRIRAEALAQQYAIPHVYTDYEQMFSEAQLDAVIVATPDDLHYPVVMAALDAGLHVACEKPMALTLADAQAMANRAQAAGVKHMLLFTFRGLPQFRYLHRLVEEAYVGRCFDVEMRFLRGDGRHSDYSWRFDRQRSLGVLGSLGSHLIDLAHWYVGDIVRVSARLTSFFEHSGPDGQPGDAANDSAMLLLEFANGAQGTIHVSSVANVGERGMEQHVVLHGSAGTLELARYANESMVGELRGVTEGTSKFQTLPIPDDILGNVNPHDWLDAFTKQSVGPRLFVDAIVNDTTPSPTFHDGVKVQAVLEAAIAAHQCGAWVTVTPSV